MEEKIQPPNYEITPPQANDLNKVSILIEILDIENYQSNQQELLMVWNRVTDLNKDLSNENEKMSCIRDLDYYINAGKWLSLIEPIPKNELKMDGSNIHSMPNGRLFLLSDIKDRKELLKKIILQDRVFKEIERMGRNKIYHNDRYTFNKFMVNILQKTWFTPDKKKLSEATCKRRLLCAVSWSKSLGILQDSRGYENWENKKSENKKSYQKLGK
jgi:hypothetical protein